LGLPGATGSERFHADGAELLRCSGRSLPAFAHAEAETDLGFDVAAADLGILRLTRGTFVDVVVIAAAE